MKKKKVRPPLVIERLWQFGVRKINKPKRVRDSMWMFNCSFKEVDHPRMVSNFWNFTNIINNHSYRKNYITFLQSLDERLS